MRKVMLALVAVLFPVASGAVEIVKNFNDWTVIKAEGGQDLIAVTINDVGHFIGFRCFAKDQKCVHVLSAKTACEDDQKYPILINSDYTAMSMEAVCGVNGEAHELYLTKYDEIHQALKKGSAIGFAIPMESGKFKVVRFSLTGSEKAMDYVEENTPEAKSGETYL